MEQGRIFKQPFKKTITFGTVFHTALYIFMASWLGKNFIFPILLNFNIEQFNSFFWGSILLVSIFIIFLLFVFASLHLIICNNYVILYDDKIVCQNRFIPVLSKTYCFEKYKNHEIIIYVRDPFPGMSSAFNRITFFKPYWETRSAGPVALGNDGCLELADILKTKGFNVKIYN